MYEYNNSRFICGGKRYGQTMEFIAEKSGTDRPKMQRGKAQRGQVQESKIQTDKIKKEKPQRMIVTDETSVYGIDMACFHEKQEE